MNYKGYYETPLGDLIILSDGENITDLAFSGQKNLNEFIPEDAIAVDEGKSFPVLEQAKKWLDIYFQGEEPDFMPPIKLIGTKFQQEVWQLLREIPYGTAVTYGDLAKIIAQKRGIKRMSAQAVGRAVGKNPVPILVPCHRVIGADGSLVGFGCGIEKKIGLLELEGIEYRHDKN